MTSASVNLLKVDYYMAKPIQGLDICASPFNGIPVGRVPVIRVFGSGFGFKFTDSNIDIESVEFEGRKTCLHVHGIFPYFYVSIPESCDDKDAYTYTLASDLNQKLNLIVGIVSKDSRVNHVYNVSHVALYPFYGYHGRKKSFVKIELYEPHMVKKASDLLQSDLMSSLGCPEVYESHIPFILQFMMDHNLRGSNSIRLKSVKFRNSKTFDFQICDKQSISCNFLNVDLFPSHQVLNHDIAPRMSTCYVEIDADVLDIEENEENGKNPGLEDLWEDERNRRKMFGFDDVALQLSESPPRKEEASVSSNSEKFWNSRFKEGLEARLKNHDFKDEISSDSDPDSTLNFLSLEDEKNQSYLPSYSAYRKLDSDDMELVEILEEMLVTPNIEEMRNLSPLKDVPPDDDDDDVETRETLEMSQIIWETDPFSQESETNLENKEEECTNFNEDDFVWKDHSFWDAF